jgi:thiamine biosynthesis protein ThiS
VDERSATIEVLVNGDARRVPSGTTVAGLIDLLGVRAELVAVEVSGALVPKARRAERVLAPGDTLEIVTLVGGG